MSNYSSAQELQTRLKRIEKKIEYEWEIFRQLDPGDRHNTWSMIKLLESSRHKFQQALEQLQGQQTREVLCLDCRSPMDERRLAVCPEALRCVKCQEAKDNRQPRRPGFALGQSRDPLYPCKVAI
jgi:RNA polymerase-binding transcription factor DksA